jgi:hypothetical protein
MSDEWKDEEPGSDAGAEEWSSELSLGDPDAWRGDSAPDPEAWRGDQHLVDWPVWDVGPEYRMWKQREDRDEPER